MKKASCIFSIILTLIMSCMMPFSVHANESLPAPFIGVNIYQDDVEYNGPYGNYFIYKIGDNYRVELQGVSFNKTIPLWHCDFVLDANYFGSVDISYVSGSATVSDTYYINGNHLELNLSINVSSFTISNVNLTNIGDFQIWNFPFESYSYINYFVKSYSSQMGSFYGNSVYQFPSFNIQNGQQVVHLWVEEGKHNYWVFASSFNIYDEATFRNGFIFSNNITVNKIKRISFDLYNFNFSGVMVDFSCDYTGDLYINTNSDRSFVPIYLASEGYPVSTEFALTFGLSNDYLDAVVYGTDQSNQSSSDLDDSSNDMNTQMQNLVTVEDGYNQQFNNSLQNIDFTSPAGNQNLLSSANFVITVFNGLIQNNFLSTLIIIICILIIGKKVIGK